MSGRHGLAAFPGDLAFGAGHSVSQVSATTAFGARWIEQLLARYNAEGPEALGNIRRRNGATATILKPEPLARLRDRLREPPADGGLWSSSKIHLDGKRTRSHISSAAAGLGSVEGDRLVDPDTTSKEPQSASPEEAAHLKKARGCPRRRGGKAPRQAGRGLRHGRAPHWPEARHAPRVEPIGERPIAHGHHRFDWLYVTAFVSPATGETFWYVSNGVSKEFFEALLATFARGTGAAEPHRPSRARQCGVAWAS